MVSPEQGFEDFPPYLIILLVAILVVQLVPESAQQVNKALVFPSSLTGWIHNVFIFGINGDLARLIPPAWSVDVELFFYCSMVLLLARSRNICIAWFVFSIVATVTMVAAGKDFTYRYHSVLGASLPFSTGALMYYFRKQLFVLSHTHVLISMSLLLLYSIFSEILWHRPVEMGFYFSLVICVYIQISLGSINKDGSAEWLKRLDVFLGDLSYPIFLCHWHAAAVLIYLAPFGISRKGAGLYIFGLLFSFFIAIIINQFIEKPIEKIRTALRTIASNSI